MPIYATPEGKAVIDEVAEPKRAQWSPTYGAQWRRRPARSRAWPGLAFVRVADVEPSIAAVACRPGESRQAVRNFLALAGVG